MPNLKDLRFDEPKKEETERTYTDIPEVDRNWWKTLLLLFLTGASAFVFSFLLKDYFFELRVLSMSDAQFASLISIAAGLFATFFFLQAVFIKGLARLMWMALLETLALAAPFYDRLNMWMLAFTALVYLMLLWGLYSGWNELRMMLRVRFFRIGKLVLPKVMTVIAIIVALVFYANVQDGRTNVLTQDLLNRLVFDPTEDLIGYFYEDFSFQNSGEVVIETVARDRIESAPEAGVLSEPQKEQLIASTVESMKAQVEDFLKVQIDYQRSLNAAVYDVLVDYLLRGSETSQLITALSVAAFVFLLVKTVGLIATYIILGFSFLMYEILVALDFATVILESRTREMIVLK